MTYTETQRPRHRLAPSVISLITAIGFFMMWSSKEIPAEKDDALYAMLFTLALGVLLTWLAYSSAVITTITREGISIKNTPFSKEKTFKWADVSSAKLEKLISMKQKALIGATQPKNQRNYTFGNTMGLLVKLKSNKNLFIGTNKETELKLFLERLKQKHDIKIIEEAQLNG